LSREGREGGEVAERRNDNSPAIHGWAIFRGSGATPKTATWTSRSPAKAQPSGQRRFGMDERGKKAVEFQQVETMSQI